MSDDQNPVSGKQKAVFDILKAMGKDMLMIPEGATIKLLGELPKFHNHHFQFKNGKLTEAAASEPKTITLDSLEKALLNFPDDVDQFEYDPLKKAFFEKPQDPPFKLAGMEVHVDPALGPDEILIQNVQNYPIQGAIADQLLNSDFGALEKKIMAQIGSSLSKHGDSIMLSGDQLTPEAIAKTVEEMVASAETTNMSLKEYMKANPKNTKQFFKLLAEQKEAKVEAELELIKADPHLSAENKKMLIGKVMAEAKKSDSTEYTRDELIGIVYSHAHARLKNKGWFTVYQMPKEDVDALIGPKTKSPYMAVRKVSINWVQRKDLWEHFEFVDLPDNTVDLDPGAKTWNFQNPPAWDAEADDAMMAAVQQPYNTGLDIDDDPNDTFMAGK